MNTDIGRRWVDALTSGGYTQGTGWLRIIDSQDTAKHCCLGVLCDLYAREHNVAWANNPWDDGSSRISTWRMLDSTAALPDAVRDWAGLTANDPFVDGSRLSYHNDGYRATFGQIAQMISDNMDVL